ncbi:MAG: AAA family ATPase [Anaerolineales bacterium]|nr:AAA family ATPase [Anaerolineales bacterium]
MNPTDAKFCENCGEMLLRICPECSTTNSPDAKYCKNCGTELTQFPDMEQKIRLQDLQQAAPSELKEKMHASRQEIEGERKPVTILFADIVGSTAIAEKLDPEEWKEIVAGAHRCVSEAIYRYEGTIAQLLGDGVLAFFGAPITHEDDPIRAVHAALDIQQNIDAYGRELSGYVDDFQMRIGINTGMVVVGTVGDDLHMEYLAVGDSVNLAARIQSAAEPGSVLISEATARLAQSAFELQDLGQAAMKGKDELIQVYEVLEVRSVPEAIRGIEGLSSPMVGRAAEFASLKDALVNLLDGHGQIVFVMGDAGIGKTRLVEEARETINGGIRWLEGRALSYGSALSYWPITQLLLGDLDLTYGDPEARMRVALRRRVTELFGEGNSETLPFLMRLLGLKQEDAHAWIKHLDSESVKQQILTSVSEYFAHVAEERPTVLFFEDMHWADPSSLEALEHLFNITDRVPLMVLILMRIERDHGSWQLKFKAETDFAHRYTQIQLKRLSSAESDQLVNYLLEISELPKNIQLIILERSEGNPLYLEEIIRNLIDHDVITREDHTWRATKEITEISIPETLQGVLLARIDRLEEDVRQTLQMASVIGKSFLFRLLEAIAEAEQQLEEHLSQLQRMDIVREKLRWPELEFMFKHSLTQEAAYNSLLVERRRAFHLKVGKAIEKLFPDRTQEFLGLLAHHFEAAEIYDKAADYCYRAGEKAYEEAALEEAISYFYRALNLYKMLDDPIKIGDVESTLGWLQWVRGDRQASLMHIHRALSILEELGETKELAFAIANISRMHMLASEHDQSITWGERVLVLAERIDVGDAMVHTLNNVGISRIWTGDMEKGMAQLQESLRLSLALGHKEAASRAYINLSEVYMATGQFAEARATLEAYREYAVRTENPLDEVMVLLNLSFVDWWCGSWKSALDRIPKLKEMDVGVFNVWARRLTGLMDNDLGRTMKACQELEDIRSSALRTGEIQTTVPILGQLARAFAASGMESETTCTIQQYIDLLDDIPYFDQNSIMPMLFACQWFASLSDNKPLEACRAGVDRLARAREQLPFPEEEAALAEGKGYLGMAEGNAKLSVEHFQKSVEAWEAQGRPYDQARTLCGLGHALVLAGEPQDARHAFDQAMGHIQALAGELEDEELRNSFLSSQLVNEIREGLEAIDITK